MPYQKTKEGRLVNEVTLGDGYPLSNDKQPLKVGGEASIINVSSPTPDGSVDGEVEIKGNLKAKDTAIEGNFSATSIESTPQFNFHSRNNISARLDVQASANQTSSIRIKNNQGYFDIKRLFSSTSLQFTDGTNTPLTLDGANVGIGTTSPDVDLDIRGTNPSIILADNSPSDNKFIAFNIDVPSDDVHTISVDQADSLAFGEKLEANDTSLENEWVRITNTGNVGIGTTSPDSPLHIQYDNSSGEGAVHSNFNNVGLQIENTNASGVAAIQLRSSDSDGYILYDDDGPNEGNFHFKTDGQDGASVLTLQDGGNVGIGTESPTTTLDVEGTVSYKHTAFTTAGPTDNVNVSDTTVLECDTSGGHVTIGGFTGGVQGQILYVVKTTTDLNRVILENNEGGGSQDIFLSSGADLSISLPGGIALYCNGSDWFALDK